MAFKLAEAYVELTNRGFGGVTGAIGRVTAAFRGMGGTISGITSMIPGVGTLLTGLGAGAGVAGLLKMSADAEQTAISFEVMLGSAEEAKKMIGDLRSFASATPFTFPGLADASTTLLGFGLAADDVIPSVSMLSNVARGNEQRLSSLALVYGQVRAAGKLTGGDLLQLINAGFNPLELIAKKTGETMAQVKDRMSDGAVSFDEVREAFIAATSEGGRFYQMNERQSQSLAGLWSTLSDNVGMSLVKIGDGIVKAFDVKEVIAEAIRLTEQFGTVVSAGVEAVQRAVGAFEGAFGSVGEWITYAMENATFFLDNWERIFLLWGEYAKLSFDNAWEHVKTWAVNAVEIATWFLDNWKDVLKTLADFVATTFTNVANIIVGSTKAGVNALFQLMDEVKNKAAGRESLRGKTTTRAREEVFDESGKMVAVIGGEQIYRPTVMEELQAELKRVSAGGLMEGFESSIKSLPSLTKANIQQSSAEIDALLGQMKFRPSTASGQGPFNPGLPGESGLSGPGAESSGKARTSQFIGLSELSRQVQQNANKSLENLQRQQLGQAVRQTEIQERQLELMERNRLPGDAAPSIAVAG